MTELGASASSVYSPASSEAKRKAPFFAVVVRASAPVDIVAQNDADAGQRGRMKIGEAAGERAGLGRLN